MASNVIGSLRVNLGIDSAAFDAGLKAAQSGAARLGASLKTAFAAAAVAASAALGGVGLAVRGVINEADQMSKAAQSVGLATEQLSELAWAADLSGVSFEALNKGLGKLSQSMMDSLKSATSDQAKAFYQLNVDVQNADGSMRSAREVLGDVANVFAGMPAGVDKTTLAMTLFGKAGKEMIPLLNNAEVGLQAMGEEARRLGLVIDTETGRRAEAFNDTLNRISKVFKGMVTQIASLVLPALQAVADTFYNAAGENQRMTFIIDASVTTFKLLASALIFVIDGFRGLTEIVIGAVDALEMVTNGDWTGANTRMEQAWRRTTETIGGSIKDIEKIWANAKATIDDSATFTPRRIGEGSPWVLGGEGKGAGKAASEISDPWKGLREATVQAKAGFEDLGKTVDNVSGQVGNAVSGWFDAALDGTFRLQDALSDLARQIARTFVNRAVTSLIGNVFGFGGLPGFANGGSFQVGGAGGIDSQLVAFRASPNERVTITKPGQMAGPAGGVVTIALGPGLEAAMLDKAAAQSVRIVQQAAPAIAQQGASAAQADYYRRGGWVGA